MTSPRTWYTTSSEYSYHDRDPAQIRDAVSPLVKRLHEYDANRARLERDGGSVSDFHAMANKLEMPVSLRHRRRDHDVCLARPAELLKTLRTIGAQDVYFSVRVRPSGLPAYYLVRVKHGYWSEYSLLVEDLYQSADYPHPDQRFVKLMDLGHETYFLRLSHFREGVAAQLGRRRGAIDESLDEVLHDVGRQVFQAAWHEDQYPAFEAAHHFDLPNFRQAVELLYLCLSGDLCAIRASLDAEIADFFEKVYPQPAIHALLQHLSELEGKALARLPDQALEAFAQLTRAFERLLRVQVRQSPKSFPVPLYKLIFANFGRLGRIAPYLARDSGLTKAAAELEQCATAVNERITAC
jgi:hypothetical protein